MKRNARLTTRALNEMGDRIKSGIMDIRFEPGYNLWKWTKVGCRNNTLSHKGTIISDAIDTISFRRNGKKYFSLVFLNNLLESYNLLGVHGRKICRMDSM